MREHWRRETLSDLLFVRARDRSLPLHETAVQKYIRRAAKAAGFRKIITARTLRHSYATHLIEKGTSTRVVQVLLGHTNVHTTETYTHVSPQTLGAIISPLDQIVAGLMPAR